MKFIIFFSQDKKKEYNNIYIVYTPVLDCLNANKFRLMLTKANSFDSYFILIRIFYVPELLEIHSFLSNYRPACDLFFVYLHLQQIMCSRGQDQAADK